MIRYHRVPDPEPDLPNNFKFGEQVAIDHMVVSKSSGRKKFLVFIVYDPFSGIVNAYPATSKGSDFVSSCLRNVLGLRFRNPDTMCRSDAAPELIKAIRDLGWLPETALPRRWPHHSKFERTIRLLRNVVYACIYKQDLPSRLGCGQSLASAQLLQLVLLMHGKKLLEQSSEVMYLVNWCFIEPSLSTNQNWILMHLQLPWLVGR